MMPGKIASATVLALSLGAFSLSAVEPASATGCLSGAVVGGVAGHYAGHHAVAGAIGGCIVGHHLKKEQQRKAAAQKVNPPTATGQTY